MTIASILIETVKSVAIKYLNAYERHYTECYNTECHYAECHYAECQYVKCHITECRHAECYYAECNDFIILYAIMLNVLC